jgi:hypothetical protein
MPPTPWKLCGFFAMMALSPNFVANFVASFVDPIFTERDRHFLATLTPGRMARVVHVHD